MCTPHMWRVSILAAGMSGSLGPPANSIWGAQVYYEHGVPDKYRWTWTNSALQERGKKARRAHQRRPVPKLGQVDADARQRRQRVGRSPWQLPGVRQARQVGRRHHILRLHTAPALAHQLKHHARPLCPSEQLSMQSLARPLCFQCMLWSHTLE